MLTLYLRITTLPPLWAACRNAHVEVVDYLLTQNATQTLFWGSYSLLMHAASEGDNAMVQCLLSHMTKEQIALKVDASKTTPEHQYYQLLQSFNGKTALDMTANDACKELIADASTKKWTVTVYNQSMESTENTQSYGYHHCLG